MENFTDTYFSVNTAILTIPDYILSDYSRFEKYIGKKYHILNVIIINKSNEIFQKTLTQ